jgi:hypothetical protein
MSVAEPPRRRTRVRLPGDVQRPFEVYVNGVAQQEGVDFVVRDGALVFERPLVREKVGAGRWTSMVLGIAGSYGKDDSVDVAYRVGGESRVAARLQLESID